MVFVKFYKLVMVATGWIEAEQTSKRANCRFTTPNLPGTGRQIAPFPPCGGAGVGSLNKETRKPGKQKRSLFMDSWIPY